MSAKSDVSNEVHTQFMIRSVALSQPLSWIRKGWQDLLYHPGASIAYGLIVTGLALVVLLIASTHIYLMAAAISGSLLVGPIMASGLCELSRRRERGESANFDNSLEALSRNKTALVRFAATLLGFSVVWFLVSGLVLFATVGNIAPALDKTVWGGFLEIVTPLQMLLYMVVGGILACIVFVLSVVSIPAIIDSQVTALDSMFLSIRVAAANVLTVLIWAGFIVVLIAIGFATFLLGMIVIYPLLGHATWYAYRDLVQN
ncbi:DUF2189 domain-containing protein [Methylophaga sp. OBS4]|uniref:DUF2189 domain-containing protein n=1 Tax=Methylophaga sp. OBS4 TaxID=2991935 RepID=UPI00224EEF90|nr:DUF2189 domain-containing protein [Methylophaga sp. OBS4]MCX4187278.1 DUF2189 domain-containing protein [Methylophaga sp. OBS4]